MVSIVDSIFPLVLTFVLFLASPLFLGFLVKTGTFRFYRNRELHVIFYGARWKKVKSDLNQVKYRLFMTKLIDYVECGGKKITV